MSAPAELRERVALFAPVKVVDALGGETVSFEPRGSAFAALETRAAAGAEDLGGRAVRLSYLGKVRAGVQIGAHWRITFRGRTLRVLAVHAPDERALIQFDAEEEVR